MAEKTKRSTIGGAILAGGDARRIEGIAKGTLEADSGLSIVEHLINEMRCSGIGDIIIVANTPGPYQDYGVEIIADKRTGIGPMGGIEAGLMHFAHKYDAVMFVPCDLPNITAEEMTVLKEAFIKSDAPAVFVETSNSFWHPLCAVADSRLVKEVSAAIDRGQRKIRNVWRKVEAVRVRFAEENAFLNINSVEDMDKWLKVKNEKKNLH